MRLRHSLGFAVLAAVAFASAPPARAQWALQGAPMENVLSLCLGVQGNKVFHQSLRGIHRQGPGDTAIFHSDGLRGACIAMERHGRDLVAGYSTSQAEGEMRRTRDGGLTWKNIGVGAPIDRNLIPFSHAGSLFAATDTTPDSRGVGHDLFRLDTVTDTWIRRGNLPAGPASAFASLGASLFASVTSHGLFRSADQGATWSSDLRPADRRVSIRGMTPFGSLLFLATPTGLFRVANDGVDWTPCDAGTPTSNFTTVGRSAANLFAGSFHGLFRSTDGGITWLPPAPPLTGKILRIASGDARTVLVEMDSKGYFVTHDDGDTWSPLKITQEPVDVVSLKSAGGILYALNYNGITPSPFATYGRLHVSADRGRTWSSEWPDSIIGIAARPEGALALRTAGDLRLRRPDGTWSDLPALPEAPSGGAVATEGAELLACSRNGVWRFGDPAAGWVSLRGDLPDSLSIGWVKASGKILFTGPTFDNDGSASFRSEDGGKHWTRCDTSFRRGLHIAATGTTHLVKLVNKGWNRSLDDGKTWTALPTVPVDSGYEPNSILARDGIFHVGGLWGRIWTSADKGITWSRTQVDPLTAWISHMAVMDGDFYAYSSSKGLYRLPGLPGVAVRREARLQARPLGPERRGTMLLFGADPSGKSPGRRADGRLSGERHFSPAR